MINDSVVTKEYLNEVLNEHTDRFERYVGALSEDFQERLSAVAELVMANRDKLEDHDKKFEVIEERFDHVEYRFEKIDERFEQIDKKFIEVDKRFGDMDIRFDQISGQLHLIRNELISKE